jgi:Glycosyltransferase family 87
MLRRVPFFLYFAVVVGLAGSIACFGWVRAWSSLLVPSPYPPFGDMRVIQGAVISVERGFNPRVLNPADPGGRLFNYPMAWIQIGKALNLENRSRFMAVSTTMIFAFVGICAFLIFRFSSFSLLASLVSSATLLGIERGNTDLVIFCLLFVSALWLPRVWSPIAILLGTALKLYPVFALGALFIKRQFRLFALSFIAAATIFAYLSDQLIAIRLTTPVSCGLSYGVPTIQECFNHLKLPFLQFAVLLGATSVAMLALSYHFGKSKAVNPQEGTILNLMLVGASIYVGTFTLSSNADYRLIFLIFCVPFLQSRPFPFARFIIVLILVAMNQLLITHWLIGGVILVWLAEIFIFIVLGAYLLALAWAALYVKSSELPPRSQLTSLSKKN